MFQAIRFYGSAPALFKKTFYFEITKITGRCKGNTERALLPFTHFPPLKKSSRSCLSKFSETRSKKCLQCDPAHA